MYFSIDILPTDLKIAPNDEEVDAIPVADFTRSLDGCINRMESTVALGYCQSEQDIQAHQTYAAFNGNPHRLPSCSVSLRPRQC